MATTKSRCISSRIPTEIYEAVDELAKRKGVTRSEWLEPVITNSVKFYLRNKTLKGVGGKTNGD